MTDADSGSEDDRSMVGEDLLKLLANDARMGILQQVWADFDFESYVTREQTPIAFSELLERTGVDDSGNLNYHLGKLAGPLLAKRDGGYVLSPLGYNLMRAITTYASYENQTVEPTPLEEACPFCGGALVASYDRELVHTCCRDCDGLADGNVNYVNLPAVDVARRDLGGILDAATIQLLDRVRSLRYGVCGQCHGRVLPTLNVCADHDPGPESACENCGIRFGAEVRVDCDHCGAGGVGPLVELAIVAPRVEAFFGAHDRGPRDLGPFRYRLACLEAVEETIHAADPAEITYTFELDSDTERVRMTGDGDDLTIHPADTS